LEEKEMDERAKETITNEERIKIVKEFYNG